MDVLHSPCEIRDRLDHSHVQIVRSGTEPDDVRPQPKLPEHRYTASAPMSRMPHQPAIRCRKTFILTHQPQEGTVWRSYGSTLSATAYVEEAKAHPLGRAAARTPGPGDWLPVEPGSHGASTVVDEAGSPRLYNCDGRLEGLRLMRYFGPRGCYQKFLFRAADQTLQRATTGTCMG